MWRFLLKSVRWFETCDKEDNYRAGVKKKVLKRHWYKDGGMDEWTQKIDIEIPIQLWNEGNNAPLAMK